MSILSIANSTYYNPNTDKTGNYYPILSYGNGPGFKPLAERVNLTLEENKNYYGKCFI